MATYFACWGIVALLGLPFVYWVFQEEDDADQDHR